MAEDLLSGWLSPDITSSFDGSSLDTSSLFTGSPGLASFDSSSLPGASGIDYSVGGVGSSGTIGLGSGLPVGAGSSVGAGAIPGDVFLPAGQTINDQNLSIINSFSEGNYTLDKNGLLSGKGALNGMSPEEGMAQLGLAPQAPSGGILSGVLGTSTPYANDTSGFSIGKSGTVTGAPDAALGAAATKGLVSASSSGASADNSGNPSNSSTDSNSGKGALNSIFGGGNGINVGTGALALGALAGLAAALGGSPKQNSVSQTANSVANANAATQTPQWNAQLSNKLYTPPVPNPNYVAGTAANNYKSVGLPTMGGGFNFAHGGALSNPRIYTTDPDHNEAVHGGPMFDSRKGDRYVQGPGDGQEDAIPAALSDGEYVVDAQTTSILGGGSNKKGAELLDKFRDEVLKKAHSQKFLPKGLGKGALSKLASGAA